MEIMAKKKTPNNHFVCFMFDSMVNPPFFGFENYMPVYLKLNKWKFYICFQDPNHSSHIILSLFSIKKTFLLKDTV
jgi:hypothetical protein